MSKDKQEKKEINPIKTGKFIQNNPGEVFKAFMEPDETKPVDKNDTDNK